MACAPALPARVIVQLPDDGGDPTGTKVTPYATWENATSRATSEPFTCTVPDDGVAEYPGTGPIEYAQVPLATGKSIEAVDEVRVVPPTVADQLVPFGRPASRTVTVSW